MEEHVSSATGISVDGIGQGEVFFIECLDFFNKWVKITPATSRTPMSAPDAAKEVILDLIDYSHK